MTGLKMYLCQAYFINNSE